MTVAEKMIEQTGVIGEKIQINGFKRLAAPFVGSYIHGNKIAALVGLASGENSADVVAKDIAMQVIGNMYDYLKVAKERTVNILVATSGDTGSAAIAALNDRENINLFVYIFLLMSVLLF